MRYINSRLTLTVTLTLTGADEKVGGIIQGSAVGQVSYVISASDLTIVTSGNSMHKYADDTYIVIPARNAQSREVELDHVTEWVQRNNLKLNHAKSVEIIFEDRRRKSQAQYPPTLPDIHRVTQIKITTYP